MDEIKGPADNINYYSKQSNKTGVPITRPTSLSSLVVWNISKVLEERPAMDLKEAVTSAQARLEEVSNAGDIQAIFSEGPLERHLACALLAWQQLGHTDADSLCKFVEENTIKDHIQIKLSTNIEASESINKPRSSKELKIKGRASPDFRAKISEVSARLEHKYKRPESHQVSEVSARLEHKYKRPESHQVSEVSARLEHKYKRPESHQVSEVVSKYKHDLNRADVRHSEEKLLPELRAQFSEVSTSYEDATESPSISSYVMGPVVRLPVETKIVMRMDAPRTGCSSGPAKKKASDRDIKSKIDQACCLDTECSERLNALDKVTNELRHRITKLAWREAERVELLERAEAAWKDLEAGYQRRLALAEEKEEDIAKQIAKMLDERAAYRDACTTLAAEVKDRTAKTEKERLRLNEIEKVVCERACQRMKLSEECAKGDAIVAENATKAAQLDRELMFKEDQARRNSESLQNEVRSVKMMTSEAERATRAELGALRDQITDVSNKLLKEDAFNEKLKAEINELCNEKEEIIEDLDGCKVQCDSEMQARLEVLNKKREALSKLREKVMECKCQLPVNKAVEVKRTPSLAALCKCTPEDKILDSCSCTSIRTKMLSNLFADLFSGLQSEMQGSVTQMPCQLLKCLDDRHNWDRASVLKTNLKDYFSSLLSGELDIAIATSIENYHAKWVGISCADKIKMKPGPDDDVECEGWEQRAIERRAQKLAEELAEQLFQERAENLIKQARDIVESAPPPCECNTRAKIPEGCRCSAGKPSGVSLTSNPPDKGSKDTVKQVYWHQATKDGPHYRVQGDDLKRETNEAVPERDTSTVVMVKPPKKARGKSTGYGDGKKGTGKLGVSNKPIASINPVADSKSNNANTSESSSWQKAIHDVMELRQQIENLKKESIKKHDLKMMEDNIANLIYCASLQANTSVNLKTKRLTDDPNTTPTNSKMKRPADPTIDSETNKKVKINKAINHPAYCDMRKTTKRRTLSPTPTEIRPKLWENRPYRRIIQKPYYKKNDAYSVNVCLCNTKRQYKRDLADIIKLDPDLWANASKISKDTMSQLSSTVKQTKPINNSFLCEDVSAQTYVSKDTTYEPVCPSNCVCFHKIPSNSSIDRLLETLAKWKCSLDASFDLKSDIKISCCDLCKADATCTLSSDAILNLNTSLKSRIMTLEESGKINSYQPNETSYEKKSAKDSAAMITTDSEYMGAIFFDKSNEDLCTCHDETKKSTKSPYKCITSGKCSCARILKERKIKEPSKSVKKDDKTKEIIVIKSKQEPQPNELFVVDNSPKIENTQSRLQQVLDSTQKNCNDINRNALNKHVLKSSDYQIEFLGVTLTDVNSPVTNPISLLSETLCENNKVTSINANSEYKKDYRNINTKSEIDQRDKISKHTRQISEFNELGKSDSKNTTETSQNLSRETNPPIPDIQRGDTMNKDSDSRYCNKDSKSTTGFIMKSSNPQIFSCECDNKLEEFKNFINATFVTHADNEDAAIDVQSLNRFKNKEDSCICCKNMNDDDCKDLEDNTFHLLEEYLKKKLNEFKAVTCSSLCIPSDEEEKIFDVILQRVKRLISQSTNQISCKCLAEEGKSQGSWKRAYGLLQEYLKMKIKKVQCSCILAEDNKDSILPDVLDKISSLIEYDFDRLKKLCMCSNAPDNLENRNKNVKQVNFEPDVSIKEHNVLLLSIQPKFPVFTQTDNYFNLLNKEPITLAIDDECRVSEEKIHKTLDESIGSVTCKSLHFNDNLLQNLNYDKGPEISTDQNRFEKNMVDDCVYNMEDSKVKIIDNVSPCHLLDHEVNKDCPSNNFKNKLNSTFRNRNNSEPTHKVTESLSFVKNCVSTNILPISKLKIQNKASLSDIDKKSSKKNNDLITEVKNEANIVTCDQSPCIPYIGYTINCTCDSSLGAHICPKNVPNTVPGVIDKIYKKLMPDEAFFNKISYILRSKSMKRDELQDDLDCVVETPEKESLHDVKLTVLGKTNSGNHGKITLKQSAADVHTRKSHIETNTVDDNESMITDCSANDDALDWCDCSSQYNSSKKIDTTQLNRLIYFPAIDDSDGQVKGNHTSRENCVLSAANTKRKPSCNCEMVPICHVKMLIDNIETKLATSKCTCDSLISKVCPVHSQMS